LGGTTTVYTANYVLGIDGQALADLAISSDPTQDFTPDAGRFLVTTGTPTGQRTANWGGWIDTYEAGGGEIGTPGLEPPPTLNPFDNISAIPSGDGMQSPSVENDNLMDASSRPWHLDPITGLWSAPAFNGLPAADLSFLGKGTTAFVTGMKDEATKEIREFI